MGSEAVFTIEVVRGQVVESGHQIHAAVVDRTGQVRSWGEPARPTIPRSAIKSIQALPLVTTGAASAFSVTVDELALACASHSGEPAHVEAVLAWLDRIGLTETDLACGPDVPIANQAERELWASGGHPRPVYNCCSGKHTAFLTTAHHQGEATEGYIKPSSGVQQRVTAAIEALTLTDLADQRPGIDGCGIPVFAIPLERLAYGMARLVDPVDLDPDLAAATGPVVEAAQQMFWVSGTGRTEVGIGDAALEPVVVKGGAEGVFMGALPQRGLGLALKAADGSQRAAQTAIRALLRELDVLPPTPEGEPLHNKAGNRSGELRAVISAPEQATLEASR